MSEEIKLSNWWNDNVENRMEEFKRWTGNHNTPTKTYSRKHIADQKYQSVIDCGCGLATEYYGFKEENCNIEYTGLDSCTYLVNHNKEQGVNMIEASLENDLPVADNSYDCVYCQEVLEHLTQYQRVITNYIRIAKKEVLIIWFIKPWTDPELIDYWPAEDLYHNKYNISELETFILSNSKVESLSWKDFEDNKSVLHIKLK